jgi:hypothetical protein
MINPTFVDDVDIPMIRDLPDEPDLPDTLPDTFPDTFPEPGVEEMTITTPTTSGMQSVELKRQKITDLYRHLGVPDNDPNLASLDRFRLTLNQRGVVVLEFIKDGDWVNLIDKRTGTWLSDATLKKRLGGEDAMNRLLGLEDTPERFKQAKTAARVLNSSIPTDLEMDSISLQDLSERTADVEVEIQRESTEGLLPMRELMGLDKALRRIQGELKNNMAKLSELDKHIDKESTKLQQLADDPLLSDDDKEASRAMIQERVKSLKEELASQNKKQLSSQFARIRQTIEKVLDGDTSFVEKIRALFREQGLTIAAIIIAVGLLISTVVGFLSGGAASAATPSPAGRAKGWVKKQLTALARLFSKLAEKLGAILPGIIGSVIGWLFNLLKKSTLFVAENMWILLVAVVGLAYKYFVDSRD